MVRLLSARLQAHPKDEPCNCGLLSESPCGTEAVAQTVNEAAFAPCASDVSHKDFVWQSCSPYDQAKLDKEVGSRDFAWVTDSRLTHDEFNTTTSYHFCLPQLRITSAYRNFEKYFERYFERYLRRYFGRYLDKYFDNYFG